VSFLFDLIEYHVDLFLFPNEELINFLNWEGYILSWVDFHQVLLHLLFGDVNHLLGVTDVFGDFNSFSHESILVTMTTIWQRIAFPLEGITDLLYFISEMSSFFEAEDVNCFLDRLTLEVVDFDVISVKESQDFSSRRSE